MTFNSSSNIDNSWNFFQPIPSVVEDMPQSSREDALIKSIMNAVVPTFKNIFSSFTHQVTGQDTLNLGDQVDWANTKIAITKATRLLEDRYIPSASEVQSLQFVIPRITYRGSEVVEDYLMDHPDIVDFLVTVWPTLTKYYGQSIGVALEVMCYPDESGTNELVGWIQCTDNDIDGGLSKLEQLDEEIFNKQLEQVGYTFNFNIEFV